MSLSARRAWIEIFCAVSLNYKEVVALRKESVDRNKRLGLLGWLRVVALRKESVDRNAFKIRIAPVDCMSLSARRAWIEITTYFDTSSIDDVALRKESVDRNITRTRIVIGCACRSPQGERG